MELQQLRAFVELARRHNFHLAAAALHVTQPTVSGYIKALEAELGTRLFERSRQGVRLTPAGQILLPYVQRSLALLSEGAAEARGGSHPSGRAALSVASIYSLSSLVLPGVLRRLHERYPDIEIHVQAASSGEVRRRILEGHCQVGWLCRPDLVPELQSLGVFRHRLLLVGAPAFATGERPLDLPAIARLPLVSFHPSMGYRKLIDGLFHRAGLRPRVVAEFNNADLIGQMVREGLGIAFLPELVIERDLAGGALQRLVTQGIPPLWHETIVVQRAGPMPSSVRALLRVLEEGGGGEGYTPIVRRSPTAARIQG